MNHISTDKRDSNRLLFFDKNNQLTNIIKNRLKEAPINIGYQ